MLLSIRSDALNRSVAQQLDLSVMILPRDQMADNCILCLVLDCHPLDGSQMNVSFQHHVIPSFPFSFGF